MADNLVPISEAKGRLSELVRDAEDANVVLMRHGRAAALLVSPARWDALLEELEDARDRLSVFEREGVTMSLAALVSELDLDD